MARSRARQLFRAIVTQRTDPEHRSLPLQTIDDLPATLLGFISQHQILLVEHQPAFAFGQVGAEFLEFGHNCPGIANWIAGAFHWRNIDYVPQQPGSLQMLEKLNAETGAIGCPFDQAGNIRDDETLLRADIDDAEVWVERSERIIGHLGSRRRDRANQRGLTRVRQTEQSDIGQHFHFQSQKA